MHANFLLRARDAQIPARTWRKDNARVALCRNKFLAALAELLLRRLLLKRADIQITAKAAGIPAALRYVFEATPQS
jgi:hypothetical protein